jgi:putative ABC transport system permease protein
MSIGQQILQALESLSSNKMRSALTILGIVIGVAAVIAMLAIGRGAQASINGSIQSIGTNLIFVSSGANGVTNPKPLTSGDVTALEDRAQAPSISKVAAVLQGRLDVTANGKVDTTSVSAVSLDYMTMRNMTVADGTMFSTSQVTGRSAVAVIGPDVATQLFNRTNNVVGQTIRMNGQPFRVIGVLASKGGGALGSQDNQILVPITTGQSRLFHRATSDRVDSILVQASDASQVQQATSQVTGILRTRHHVQPGKEDFTLLSQNDILSTANSITGVLTIFLGGIAAISLLVGGIGIMNIMLVSVTERTREIGLRKAIGARRVDILVQFLMESITLSLLGGILGIILAAGISYVVGQIAAAQNAPIQPQISAGSVLMATLFSMAVGLFFGLYPANRASMLQPVEALRYE